MSEKLSDLKPINGRVMVEFQPRVERKSKAGILMPAEVKNEGLPNRGLVLLVADDVEGVKPGDFVFYQCINPVSIRYADKKIIVVHIDEIQATGKPDNA